MIIYVNSGFPHPLIRNPLMRFHLPRIQKPSTQIVAKKTAISPQAAQKFRTDRSVPHGSVRSALSGSSITQGDIRHKDYIAVSDRHRPDPLTAAGTNGFITRKRQSVTRREHLPGTVTGSAGRVMIS
jgi:hypothetical protein